MFQVGDVIVYGGHGVSRIITQENRIVDGKKISYFVLEPMGQPSARFYVPAENPAALKKLRHVIKKEEVHEILDSVVILDDDWIEDEKQRKKRYGELTHGSDYSSLLQMIVSLYRHRERLSLQGRKLHLCDENFLRDVVKMIDAEFTLALGLEPGEVGAYIEEELRKRRLNTTL